jgi:predicted PurR-regulated permease PerM
MMGRSVMPDMLLRKKLRRISAVVLTLCVSVAFVVLAAVGIIGFNRSLQHQQLAAVQQSVQNAVIHCYSLEGSYPPNLEYLHKSYGLILDKTHYIYDYSIFASNIPPEVHILRKS